MHQESRAEIIGIRSAMRTPVRVYLVGRPQFDVEEFLSFLAEARTSWRRSAGASEAEELIAAAGRVCYMSFGPAQSSRSNTDYIRNLVKMGHESVLEHVSWSFVIAGITRALSHQLVRHRVADLPRRKLDGRPCQCSSSGSPDASEGGHAQTEQPLADRRLPTGPFHQPEVETERHGYQREPDHLRDDRVVGPRWITILREPDDGGHAAGVGEEEAPIDQVCGDAFETGHENGRL